MMKKNEDIFVKESGISQIGSHLMEEPFTMKYSS